LVACHVLEGLVRGHADRDDITLSDKWIPRERTLTRRSGRSGVLEV
jgi:hypothetical protein